jgi:GNAT superfamily N-acetyltransferase
VRVRRIGGADGLVLREVRLRSLRESPEAFGQRPEEADAQPIEEWHAAARAASAGDRRAWFLAVPAGALGTPVGVVLGRRRPPGTLLIFSMWVDPAWRRAGVGRSLISAVEAWASGWGATRAVLWVFGANEAAQRFYQRLGYGVEIDGDDARTGVSHGALAMVRSLDGAGPRP